MIIKIKDDEDSGDETSTGESRSSDNLTQPAVTNAVYITEFRPDQTGKYLVTGGLGALGIEVLSLFKPIDFNHAYPANKKKISLDLGMQ